MKIIRKIGTTLVIVVAGYIFAFLVLGWLAPHNMTINRFYSSAFYTLRCYAESDYLNRVDRHDGVLRYSVSGEPAIQKDSHTGVGFEVPALLRNTIEKIPDGTEVIGYIGKRLDRESIGIYHNELRNIQRKDA